MASLDTSDVPVGTIVMWGGLVNIPAGWQQCDGTILNRQSFPELFEAIGTNFGKGVSEDSFCLPDLQGRFVRGFSNDNADRDPDVATRTDSVDPETSWTGVGSLQSHALETHVHNYVHFPYMQGPGAIAGSNWNVNPSETTTAPIAPCQVSQSETRPVNVYLMFIIKCQ